MKFRWERFEVVTSQGAILVEYTLEGKRCSIRSCFDAFGRVKEGWDVICFKDSFPGLIVEKNAWFLYISDAKFWVESCIDFD